MHTVSGCTPLTRSPIARNRPCKSAAAAFESILLYTNPIKSERWWSRKRPVMPVGAVMLEGEVMLEREVMPVGAVLLGGEGMVGGGVMAGGVMGTGEGR